MKGSVTISFLFLGKMMLVMLVIYLLAILTPKIAKKIDSSIENTHKNKISEDERLYQVQSVFEPHPDDEKPNKSLFPEVSEEKKYIITDRNEDS